VSLRDDLRARPLLASFVGIGHPAVAEIMAWRGFRLLCIDGEHSAFGPAAVEELIRAGGAAGARTLVRVPGIGPAIGHALDSGADGIIVPRVASAGEARQAVDAVRYPPAGQRGAGIGRAAKYGQDLGGLLARANDDVLLVVQVETRAGVEAAREIAAVDGVDVIFVGPGDLAVSLGCEIGSDPHRAAVAAIIDAGLAAGRLVGIFCLTPDQIPQWADRGVRLFIVGSDLGFLGGAAADAAAAADAILAPAAAEPPRA
jgi:2-keto-3-deoxy-L-rhamnonate aldolase RhmA